MSLRFPGLLAGLVLLVTCSACTVTRPPAEFFDDLQEASAVDPSFLAGMRQLAPPSPEQAEAASDEFWQQTDNCILLGVKASYHGRTSVWFVRLSSAPHENPPAGIRYAPFPVPLNIGELSTRMRLIAPAEKVWVETYDDSGTLVQASIRSVPRGIEPASVASLCQYFSAFAQEGGADEAPTQSASREALAAALIRVSVLGSSRSLRPVHEAAKNNIVRIPGVLDLVTSGFSRQVELSVHQSQLQMRSPMGWLGPMPGTELRFQVRAAGQAMFNGRLVCRQPDPPFDLTGGLVMLEAVHPANPANRLTMCVLAARHREAPRE